MLRTYVSGTWPPASPDLAYSPEARRPLIVHGRPVVERTRGRLSSGPI